MLPVMRPETTFGPVQMLSVVFDGFHFKGEILPELERLKAAGVVRIIDLLLIRKDEQGAVVDPDCDRPRVGGGVAVRAYIGSLVGLGSGGEEGFDRGAIAGAAELADGHFFDEDDVFRLAGVVPPGSSVAMILLEHLWAIPLKEAVKRAQGFELDSMWVTPDELVRVGLVAGIGRRGAAGGLLTPPLALRNGEAGGRRRGGAARALRRDVPGDAAAGRDLREGAAAVVGRLPGRVHGLQRRRDRQRRPGSPAADRGVRAARGPEPLVDLLLAEPVPLAPVPARSGRDDLAARRSAVRRVPADLRRLLRRRPARSATRSSASRSSGSSTGHSTVSCAPGPTAPARRTCRSSSRSARR